MIVAFKLEIAEICARAHLQKSIKKIEYFYHGRASPYVKVLLDLKM